MNEFNETSIADVTANAPVTTTMSDKVQTGLVIAGVGMSIQALAYGIYAICKNWRKPKLTPEQLQAACEQYAAKQNEKENEKQNNNKNA